MRGIAKEINSPLSARELLLLGNIGPCELIKGEVKMNAPAGWRHGEVALQIGNLLCNYVKAHDLGKICAAETGFLISHNPDTVRAPDAAFVRKGRIPKEGIEGYLPFAPDLAVEVVSPNDRWSEIEEKVMEWLNSGTRLVWVIDPRTRTIHVYRSPKEVSLLLEQDMLGGEEVLPGFSVAVIEVFQ